MANLTVTSLSCIIIAITAHFWIANAKSLLMEASVADFVNELRTLMKDELAINQDTPPVDEEKINDTLLAQNDFLTETGVAKRSHMYGDMILTSEQEKYLFPKSEQGLAQGFLSVNRWPYAVVPYELDLGLGLMAVGAINSAIKEFELKSCIRFVLRTPTNRLKYLNYVYFASLDGCYSYVGMIGKKQVISIGDGCEFKGIVQHEVLHALGRIHEQSRPDRDTYVTINEANIEPGMKNNFFKETKANIGELPYDYGSIMHYAVDDFSANGLPTLTLLRPTNGAVVGQRDGLTKLDWQHLNQVYCTGQLEIQSFD